MKRLLLTALSVCLYMAAAFAQGSNHSQALFDMLWNNECFRARDYMREHQDSIAPEVKLFYKQKMCELLNQADSAAFYFDRMLNECPAFFPDENMKLSGFGALLNLYAKARNYEKAFEVLQKVELYFQQESSLAADSAGLQNQLAIINRLKEETLQETRIPKMKLTALESVNNVIRIANDSLFSVPAECNGTQVKAILDTGFQFDLWVTESKAKECGMNKVLSTDSIQINGVSTKAKRVLVDSLRIGNVLVENISATVVDDNYLSLYPDSVELTESQKAKYDSIFSNVNFIVGLPILRKLGCIDINWAKKEAYITVPEQVARNDKEPNLCIENDYLYAHLTVNSNDFIGFVDMGSTLSALTLSPTFYEKHKDTIQLDTNIMGKKGERIYGVTLFSPEAKFQFVQNPVVCLDSKTVNLGKEDVTFWHVPTMATPQKEKDGTVGLVFLKRLGHKVRLDFVNMRITAE